MPEFSSMIVYELPPIDWWDGWINLELFSARLFGSIEECKEGPYNLSPDVAFERKVKRFIAEAEVLAYELGWEGDMSGGPFLSAIPRGDGSDSLHMIGWKQRNNGTTYVATEVPLVHLDDQKHSSAYFKNGVAAIRFAGG